MNKKTKYIKSLFKASVVFICIIFLATLAKLADALTFAKIQKIASEVTVQIYAKDIRKPTESIAVGSGVIIPSVEQNTYYIVTNKYVAYSGGDYVVKTFDGYEHTIKSKDVINLSNSDLSWLKFTSSKNYNAVELGDSQDLQTGDSIYVGGWSFNDENIEFSRGKIKRTNMKNKPDGYSISYGMPTENGMSGGPLLDTNGHLIGIHGRDRLFYRLGIPINTFIENSGINWLRICNERKPSLEISLALAKYVGDGWETKGWYKIKPQSCKPLLAIGEDYKGKVYYYAYNSDDIFWGNGPKKFCVNMQSNFTIVNRKNGDCNDSNFKQVRMSEVEVYPEMESPKLVN